MKVRSVISSEIYCKNVLRFSYVTRTVRRARGRRFGLIRSGRGNLCGPINNQTPFEIPTYYSFLRRQQTKIGSKKDKEYFDFISNQSN